MIDEQSNNYIVGEVTSRATIDVFISMAERNIVSLLNYITIIVSYSFRKHWY